VIVEQLVDRAMEEAQGAQASVVQKDLTEVSFENDVVKSAESSQSTEIKVRVVVGGRIGTSHSTDIHDLDGVVARALEVAEFGALCTFEFPGHQAGTAVKVYDRAVVPVTKSELIQVGQEMKGLIKAYDTDAIVRGGMDKAIAKREFANSGGVNFANESTFFGAWILGQRVRGSDIFEAWHGFACKKRAIDHVAIARQTVEMLRMGENIAPIHSGRMPVIFTPIAMDVLLLSLRLGLDGKHVFTKYSPLAGRLGEQMADSRFSLTENPLIDYAALSSMYDDEGVPRRIVPLIENGVVRSFLHDLDSAGRAGTQSTGHGEGRNPTNLIIKPGDTPYEEMVKSIGEGLLVYYVMGLGQGNPVSGEFSVGVRVGYKIENGEVVGRVKDVMLSGNVYDALTDIVAISDGAEWARGWYSGAFPHIQVGELNVVTH